MFWIAQAYTDAYEMAFGLGRHTAAKAKREVEARERPAGKRPVVQTPRPKR